MEMIIGCLFFAVLIVFLAIYLKNTTIVLNINYPEPKVIEVKDTFDDEGEPLDKDEKANFDDILKEVNNIMLGKEESDE